MDKVDALYFTVTVFSTVGFGDITAKTDLARTLVTIQMLFNLVVVGLIAKVILGAVNVGQKKRSAEHQATSTGDRPEHPTGSATAGS
jgi:subtilase family serine protease